MTKKLDKNMPKLHVLHVVMYSSVVQRIRDFCDDALYKSTFTIPYHDMETFFCTYDRVFGIGEFKYAFPIFREQMVLP